MCVSWRVIWCLVIDQRYVWLLQLNLNYFIIWGPLPWKFDHSQWSYKLPSIEVKVSINLSWNFFQNENLVSAPSVDIIYLISCCWKPNFNKVKLTPQEQHFLAPGILFLAREYSHHEPVDFLFCRNIKKFCIDSQGKWHKQCPCPFHLINW